MNAIIIALLLSAQTPDTSEVLSFNETAGLERSCSIEMDDKNMTLNQSLMLMGCLGYMQGSLDQLRATDQFIPIYCVSKYYHSTSADDFRRKFLEFVDDSPKYRKKLSIATILDLAKEIFPCKDNP